MSNIQDCLRQDVNQIQVGDIVFHRLSGNKGKVSILGEKYLGIYWFGGNEGEKLFQKILHPFWTHKNLLLKECSE
jgi:hypothetical protein